MLGCTIRTPETKDGLLREKVLRHMDRPVADEERVGHFVPPHKTREIVARRGMTFDQLKAELPSIGKHPFESEEVKERAIADTEAGGAKLFKGERVRDVVECSNVPNSDRGFVAKSTLSTLVVREGWLGNFRDPWRNCTGILQSTSPTSCEVLQRPPIGLAKRLVMPSAKSSSWLASYSFWVASL